MSVIYLIDQDGDVGFMDEESGKLYFPLARIATAMLKTFGYFADAGLIQEQGHTRKQAVRTGLESYRTVSQAEAMEAWDAKGGIV